MRNTTMIYTFLVFLLTLTLTLTPGAAQAVDPNPNTPSEFLDAHNRARAAIVPPLKWSNQLAQTAIRIAKDQRAKKNCEMLASNQNSYNLGRNQFLSGTRSTVVTPRMAVDSWVEEKKFYNYGRDSCSPGQQCGLYKQVVWRNSTELGCALENCVKEQVALVICFYSPSGNIVGQKPY